MGYESRLYVVQKMGWTNEKKKTFAQVIAMFDLCQYYSLSDVLRNKPETNCYIFSDDGKSEITKDRYGMPLTESDVKTVIDILEKDIARGENYRRILPLLSTLKVFEKQQQEGLWDHIVVLHYGY
jgi:hypothetical protein